MKRCKTFDRMSGSRITPLLLMVLFGTTGCGGPESISPSSRRKIAISDAFSPLGIGSSREEVEQTCGATWSPSQILVHPGQMAPGGEGKLPNGVNLTVAFNDQDRVFYLASSDSRVRVATTLGVGASIEQVTKSLPGASILQLPGYGTLIRAEERTWLAFCPTVPSLAPTDKVSWVELRSDLSPTP